ncbi:MAG: questin oxidase family protein [Proteobacteria bacterium]|nr:questin oxidase family protein [Pseudomonadota bacterium]
MNSFELISDANKRYSSQYLGELANHLPMDLVALERLGASVERLRTYRDHYVERLEPVLDSLGMLISEANWQEFLGQNKYHVDYIHYFEKFLATNGLRKTLEFHLPTLFRGVAGGAFHGLIRLGYALDSNNMEEVSQALGYWAISFLDLGIEQVNCGTKNSKEIFSELSTEFLGFRPEAPNIARRMELIARLARFRQICAGLNVEIATYENIAPLVLELFAQTNDFTALHAVTATHAYRLVSKYHSASIEIFIALSAAYVSIRAPKIQVLEPVSIDVHWNSLKERAVRSNDDHVPKIVYTCFQEYCVHSDSRYFLAACTYVEKFC